MPYDEALDFLFALPRFTQVGADAYKPGLDRIRALMEAFGNPHEAFSSIHIAGTNGKGSTAAMVAAIGTASGGSVGLHTSPHLLDFAERMRINGRPADHGWISEAVSDHKTLFREIGASFFEASVALSFLYFADMQVDAAVVEVGMGGRLDATNILVPTVCGITHIGLDHTEELGSTRAEIAREKGGIAKAGVPLLSLVEGEDARNALRGTVLALGASFEDVNQTTSVLEDEDGVHFKTPVNVYTIPALDLIGNHQVANARLAVRLAEVVWEGLATDAVQKGLLETRNLSGLRGRLETMSEDPRIMVDVAHNPDGWNAALKEVRHLTSGTLYVAVGVMRDKNLDALCDLLSAYDVVALPVG
ncbi:MAG: Mur ligase family protein, partial [Rubricoccaceae bacterium]|nr:Mur ligase family protein [Rubricoccaceae bacterium]